MEVAGEIDWLDWIVVAIFTIGILVSAHLLVNAQGDLLVDDTIRGTNDDNDATNIFLYLVSTARKSIIIHDDGNNSPDSVYNNPDVIEAMRRGIQRYGVNIKCLFNDDSDELAFMALAREFPNNVAVWYWDGERPERDIHYKIIDGGKLVHLSIHAHDSNEREYVLRQADKWWVAKGTRRRISKAYREMFDRGVKVSRRARFENQAAA